VARDRIISTVNPQGAAQTRTAPRRFDGYQDHVGIEPNTEIITATTVTPGTPGTASRCRPRNCGWYLDRLYSGGAPPVDVMAALPLPGLAV